MPKTVRVIQRDVRKRPILVALRGENSPVEIIVERGSLDWFPLYGVRDDRQIELPRNFHLSREHLEILDRTV